VSPPGPPQPASMQPDHLTQSQRQESAADVPIPYVFEGGEVSYSLSLAMPGKIKAGYPSPSGSYQLPKTTLDATHSSPGEYHMAHTPNDGPRTDTMLTLLTPSSTTTDDPLYKGRSNSVPPSVSTVLPPHVSPTCPLDQVLHSFLNTRRDMIAQGMPLDTVIGPAKPTVKALLNTELTGSVHPLSGVMSDVLSTFPSVAQPEKLAFFYLMYHMMRVRNSQDTKDHQWLTGTVANFAY
jgi:hypothetical protein